MAQVQNDKAYHEKLAGIVKSTHAKLRLEYKTSGNDLEKVWQDHCQNETLLSEYAEAMHHLATDVWTKRPDTRIEWCKETCLKYFYGGGLEKVLGKEKRRREFKLARAAQNSNIVSKDESQSCISCTQTLDGTRLRPERNSQDSKRFQKELVDSGQESESLEYEPIVRVPFQEKLRLLDVGSCYNAFSKFEEFSAIGIDISPAVPEVIRCDFLNVDLSANSMEDDELFNSFHKQLEHPIPFLPRQSFHIVVFSLLLEYFPSPLQRWTCIKKAQELLMLNGLLVIITPDSHHQNKNAPMMKSWRKAIEYLGFSRYCYEKQEHLHCMAYRKIKSKSLNSKDDTHQNDIGPNLLYIPQDSNELAVPEKDGGHCESENQISRESICEDFSDLPLYVDE